jgi:hypothetical protein
MNMLSYHVFDGHKWLGEDERTWTNDYHSSASFGDPKRAQDIGERAAGETRTIYVMGCLGWQ